MIGKSRKCCKFLEKSSLCKVAFLQAIGLVFYCGLVGMVMWNGDSWFGKMNSYLGPVLVLVLLVLSVLVCALLGLGHPFLLFWEEKRPRDAVRLVLYTTLWLLGLLLLLMFALSFL